MTEQIKRKVVFSLTEIILITWLIVVSSSLILALLGLFYPFLVGLTGALTAAIFWWLHHQQKINIKPLLKTEIILIGLITSWGIFLATYVTPTIYGGRDEGSLSTAAFLINQSHGLTFSAPLFNDFGKIYGEGKALNFPGFFYQEKNEKFVLKSQFLPGYPVYLANFARPHYFFLIKFSNVLPLLIFALSFYLVVKQLIPSTKFAALALLVLLTSVPLNILFKSTLSEIFFAALLWPALYFLIKYFSSKKDYYLFLTFLALFPAFFTRVETLGIFAALILILIAYRHRLFSQAGFQKILLTALALLALDIVLFNNFFVQTGKAFVESLLKIGSGSSVTGSFSSGQKIVYIFQIFYLYNLLPLFFFALAAIFKSIVKRKNKLLLPLFFLGITAIYLVMPNISLDHPWLLRRFVFSVIPLMILYTVIFVYYYLRPTRWRQIILIILIATNLLMSAPFIIFSPYQQLERQTAALASFLPENSLLLVSQQSSGSGWTLLSEPLRTVFHQSAVYFFNPNDYAKIDQNKYRHIYLLTSQPEMSLFRPLLTSNRGIIVKEIDFQYSLLRPSNDPRQLPPLDQQQIKSVLIQLK